MIGNYFFFVVKLDVEKSSQDFFFVSFRSFLQIVFLSLVSSVNRLCCDLQKKRTERLLGKALRLSSVKIFRFQKSLLFAESHDSRAIRRGGAHGRLCAAETNLGKGPF
jgi:hypothetical protein